MLIGIRKPHPSESWPSKTAWWMTSTSSLPQISCSNSSLQAVPFFSSVACHTGECELDLQRARDINREREALPWLCVWAMTQKSNPMMNDMVAIWVDDAGRQRKSYVIMRCKQSLVGHVADLPGVHGSAPETDAACNPHRRPYTTLRGCLKHTRMQLSTGGGECYLQFRHTIRLSYQKTFR